MMFSASPDYGMKLDERAKELLRVARGESDRLKHEYLGTEHIVLAMLLLPDVAGALRDAGVNVDQASTLLATTVTPGSRATKKDDVVPPTSRTKKSFGYASEHAKAANRTDVGLADILAGLLREKMNIAAQVLLECGLTPAVEAEVAKRLNAVEDDEINPAQEMVRHTLATLAYRAAKAVRGAPDHFGAFRIGATTRTPADIVAHMGDLMEWALTMAEGRTQWRDAGVHAWTDDVQRLFDGITALDQYLSSGARLEQSVLHQLFQGPIADALTHTGQLTLLRRLADSPVRGESYNRAQIASGQTGRDQPPPRREFD